MKHVKILPFVGANYNTARQKILMLGVKQHSSDPSAITCEANNDVVNLYLHHNDGYVESFFDTFDRAIDTIRDKDESREEAWQRVMFFNYTQIALLSYNSWPSDEQIEKDGIALREVLLAYKPDKIIVWGKRLYDSILYGYGQNAQLIDARESWMLNTNDLTGEAEEMPHVYHMTYINDPSHSDFDTDMWRKTTLKFLCSEPVPYQNSQVKSRVVKILNFLQIDYENYITNNGTNLLDLLAKGITSGLLHFTSENAIPELLRIKADSVIATVCFADNLRRYLHHKLSYSQSVYNMSATFMELASHNLEMTMDEGHDNSTISFTGKKRRVKKLFDELSKIRSTDTGRQIDWQTLENLFDVKNMRQYVKDICPTKEYSVKIGKFFRRMD